MADPTDRPAHQAGPDRREQLVRLDMGGWISGPCLGPDELELPAGWRADPGSAWPADGHQRPAQ
jgi:hypothetical protein